MKTIVRSVISLLFVIGLVTGYMGTPAAAHSSQPSASGTYRFVLEDGFTKSLEFNATTDERGTTTGQMTFRDEARVTVQDVDGVGGHEESSSEFYMTAVLDSMTIDHNRAVMSGTIADSSVRSYIGKWVQLVVEDNGDGRDDKFTWCFCQPEEGGWVPADSELREDQGAFAQWWATDAEVERDEGVQSTNIIPGNATQCKVFPLAAYPFADMRDGEGQIQVQP
ncbi:MAG TPA: hypothetical protein VJT71_12945 [Pyrinomonadaceae bacterium]|nr:hypothetical protein [Pyrinomonadaceae bacterium]